MQVLTRAVNRWQQSALARQSQIKAKRSARVRPLPKRQGERGGLIWQSRSKPIVIGLWFRLINGAALLAARHKDLHDKNLGSIAFFP